MSALRVPSVEDFEAMERRVADLERKLSRMRVGAGWIPVVKSPIGPRATRRLIRSGQLQATRQGRRLFVLADDVDAYLAARPVVVAPPAVEPSDDDDDGRSYAERHVHLLVAGARGTRAT